MRKTCNLPAPTLPDRTFGDSVDPAALFLIVLGAVLLIVAIGMFLS